MPPQGQFIPPQGQFIPPQGQFIPPQGQLMPPQGQPIPPPGQPFQPLAQPIQVGTPMYQPPMQNQPLVVNQYVPLLNTHFKTSPVALVCPHCNQNIVTEVETQFNCANCCLCCWNWVIWLVIQLVRDKEFNCTDATHRCPNCKNVLGKYDAC